eukprot:6013085-Amphidinium_carterae.1
MLVAFKEFLVAESMVDVVKRGRMLTESAFLRYLGTAEGLSHYSPPRPTKLHMHVIATTSLPSVILNRYNSECYLGIDDFGFLSTDEGKVKYRELQEEVGAISDTNRRGVAR